MNILSCEGIELVGMELSKVTTKDSVLIDPLLETYEFVDYNKTSKERVSLSEAIGIILQIVLQNIPGLVRKISVCEIKSVNTNQMIIIKEIKSTLSKQPLVKPTYCELAINQFGSEYDIILLDEMTLIEINIKKTSDMLSENGFIIYSGSQKPIEASNLELISNFRTESTDLFLLRPTFNISKNEFVLIRADLNNFSWIKDFLLSFDRKKYKKVYICGEVEKYCGILGLINCLKCEVSDLKFGVFMLDKISRSFLSNFHDNKQIRKNLIYNLHKQNTWGTYIHKPFNTNEKKIVSNATVSMTNFRELCSLRWLETPTTFLR